MSAPQFDPEKNNTPSNNSPVEDYTDRVSSKSPSSFEVSLDPQDDPKSLPLWRKWVAALIINAGVICVTGASSMVRMAYRFMLAH